MGAPSSNQGSAKLLKLSYGDTNATTAIDWMMSWNSELTNSRLETSVAMVTSEHLSAIALGAPLAVGYVDLFVSEGDTPSFATGCQVRLYGPIENEEFGFSVALSLSLDEKKSKSGYLAVGAPAYRDDQSTRVGAVYVYSFSISTEPCFVAPLIGGSPIFTPIRSFISFGYSISFGKSGSNDGDEDLTQLLIGAPITGGRRRLQERQSIDQSRLLPSDELSGATLSYIYNSKAKTFQLNQIFRPVGYDPLTGFGLSVAASDSALFVVGSSSGESS
jgi:hypothetical protein